MADLQLESVLRCPVCGHAESLLMRTDACMFFHNCGDCGHMMKPVAGDCCVFCSYGSVPCPPVQMGERGCCDQ